MKTTQGSNRLTYSAAQINDVTTKSDFSISNGPTPTITLTMRENGVASQTLPFCPNQPHHKRSTGGVKAAIFYRTGMVNFGLSVQCFKASCQGRTGNTNRRFHTQIFLRMTPIFIAPYVKNYLFQRLLPMFKARDNADAVKGEMCHVDVSARYETSRNDDTDVDMTDEDWDEAVGEGDSVETTPTTVRLSNATVVANVRVGKPKLTYRGLVCQYTLARDSERGANMIAKYIYRADQVAVIRPLTNLSARCVRRNFTIIKMFGNTILRLS